MGGSGAAGMALKWHEAPRLASGLRHGLGCALPMSETKFAQFLATKKIDRRRIIAASYILEAFRPEDRAIKLKRRQVRANAADATAAAAATKDTPKARSG